MGKVKAKELLIKYLIKMQDWAQVLRMEEGRKSEQNILE